MNGPEGHYAAWKQQDTETDTIVIALRWGVQKHQTHRSRVAQCLPGDGGRVNRERGYSSSYIRWTSPTELM